MNTGFVYHPAFLEHDPGKGHPECAERLSVSMDYLQTLPWFKSLKRIMPITADLDWIATIHHADYIRRARTTCLAGANHLDCVDVGICRDSYEIALLAAGAPLTLADEIITGNIQNGFCLLRPPGHHAEANTALGFCLFNNIAILSRYLQKQHGIEKILILDWDVHHGNGTQHTFEEDPSVLYISTHQYPYYPGTGATYETGCGRGNGATLNCPMPAGSTDIHYEAVFIDTILPKIHAFKPEFTLISAGFDAHYDDPLGQIDLSTQFFGWMTERMLEIADHYSEGRIISLLEGGYHLQALALCVAEHLKALSGVRENTMTT